MQIEINICDVGVEQRWNWLQSFNPPTDGRVLGAFISYRDDSKLVWLHGFPGASPNVRTGASKVRIITPSIGSTITTLDDFARIADPVIELRQYRIAKGKRAQFATFLRDRTLQEQTRRGMNVYGPFDDIEDENNLVWFRGFPDLFERDKRKASFYQSKLWLEELESEAFTMIEDYSNVMLLMPVQLP
jgi:hypothetical protein